MVLRFYLKIILVTCWVRYKGAYGFLDKEEDILPTAGFLPSKSPLHLMKFARLDRLIYTKLEAYKVELNKRLKIIQAYTNDFEKYSLDVASVTFDDPDHWNWATQTSSQPIRALRLVRRMTSLLPMVMEHIGLGAETEFLNTIYGVKEGLDWPSRADLEVIQESLLDIPIVFDNIPVSDISEGKLQGNSQLEASECNDFGVAAYDRNRYASAIQWFDAASKRFHAENSQTIPIEYLEGNFNEATTKHDAQLTKLMQSKGQSQLSQFWDRDLFVQNIANLQGLDGNSLRHLHALELEGDKMNPQVRFWQICSGGNYQRPKERNGGICFYLKKFHAYLILNPYKVEVFNRFPLVVQIHDFNTQSSSIALISAGMGQLETWNGIHEGLVDDDKRKRLPVPAIVNSQELDSLATFESRIQFLRYISGRSTEHVTTERLHVGVYSFTNYDKSLDRFPDPVISDGVNEQETLNVHLFLNTVDMGGQTVFPRLGFGVKPIQNSALIWSEYKLNGVGHPDLFWTNCPIVSGNKWVATKYVRRAGTNLRAINIFS